MISFKQFLKLREDGSVAAACAERIFKDCVPYLKQARIRVDRNNIRRSTGLLWRGMKGLAGDSSNPCMRLAGNRERKPSDTNLALHAILDTHLFKHFGFHYRSKGVFCSNSPVQASGYSSDLYLIFPIGHFKYVWSDTLYDAYAELDNRWHSNPPQSYLIILHDMQVQHEGLVDENGFPVDYDAWYELVGQWLEKTRPYKDSGLQECLREHEGGDGFGREIMLQCSEYYAVNIHDAPMVLETLQELLK
jgi:hypothetical protein